MFVFFFVESILYNNKINVLRLFFIITVLYFCVIIIKIIEKGLVSALMVMFKPFFISLENFVRTHTRTHHLTKYDNNTYYIA